MITAVEAKEEFSPNLLDSLHTLCLAWDNIRPERIKKNVLSTVDFFNYQLLSLSMSVTVLLLLEQKMKCSSLIKVFHYQKT